MTALLYFALWLAGLYIAWALCVVAKRGDACQGCPIGCGSQACAERCARKEER